MLTYWLIFSLLAIPALVQPLSRRESLAPWLLVGILLAWFIGFRHEVGGDWYAYLRHFVDAIGVKEWSEIFSESDPGYVLLNWIMGRLGFGIYAVNLVCGSIFAIGLIAFARRQPYPWLAMVVAFPYLVLVVAMGYARQGVSIGFILLALNVLQSRQFARYLAFIALATLFHRTALIILPLGFFLWGKGWWFRSFALIAAGYVLYDLLVAEEVDDLWQNYVVAEMESEGARIRAWMNLVPAVILLRYWNTWRVSFPDYWFWFWIAVGSIASVFLVDFSSTAVDRMALYFLPIQLVVFAHLPLLLGRTFSPVLIRTGIVVGYGAVMYVWLNYAVHSQYWLPYRNLLLE